MDIQTRFRRFQADRAETDPDETALELSLAWNKYKKEEPEEEIEPEEPDLCKDRLSTEEFYPDFRGETLNLVEGRKNQYHIGIAKHRGIENDTVVALGYKAKVITCEPSHDGKETFDASMYNLGVTGDGNKYYIEITRTRNQKLHPAEVSPILEIWLKPYITEKKALIVDRNTTLRIYRRREYCNVAETLEVYRKAFLQDIGSILGPGVEDPLEWLKGSAVQHVTHETRARLMIYLYTLKAFAPEAQYTKVELIGARDPLLRLYEQTFRVK